MSKKRLAAIGGLAGAGFAYYLFREEKKDLSIHPSGNAAISGDDPAAQPNITATNLNVTQSALDPDSWKSFKVVSKESVTPNTYRLRFQFPDQNQASGLFTASCLLTKAPIGEQQEGGARKPVIRPYTPENLGDQKGYLDLVVKGYPQGLMSKHIVDLEPGDELEFKGPIPKLPYKANMKKAIGMIAGGSGLTPMLQVIKEIARNAADVTQVSFIFANQSVDDIILKKELDELKSKHDNIDVFYVVDKAPSKDWKEGAEGYITAEIAKQKLPPPSDDNLILVCGPPPMMKAISGPKKSPKDQGELDGILKELGYTKDQVYKF